jgi:dienelactone hydrolase
MIAPIRTALLGIAFGFWLGIGAASAGAIVEFPAISQHGPERLAGYLARPDAGLSALMAGPSSGAAAFPAVVVLHGCSGISSHSAGIADKLGGWGYVALTVDSLGPRGIANHCGSGFPDQAYDAYAALRYLASQEFVDPARIAVLGQSMGGSAVLGAVDRDMTAQYFAERFRAAIAYYPGNCMPAARMTAPTLILIGDADDQTPAEPCRQMAAKARPDSAPIALTVYPGAHHSFDVAWLRPGRRSRGHWIEYNEAAASDAEAKLRAFLAAHLAGASDELTAK